MTILSNLNLIHANFFFVDIVGLSDPAMSTKTQIKKIETLNKCIMECAAFKETPKELMLVLPTGDGMAIGFLQGPQFPLQLAIELHKRLAQYNRDKIPSETVRVRVGMHAGNVFVVNDVLGNKNVWGPGIIIARRVMDLGDDGHILVSTRMAEDLRELSDEYKRMIKPVHDYSIKHGQALLLYSAYGTGFGNPRPPVKGSFQRSKMGREALRLVKTALYPFVQVDMTLKNSKTQLMHYKRTYEIENISDDPIHHVLHGITSDVDKTFDELNIKVYDDHGHDLKISSISIDKPRQKEFTTLFNTPVEKGERSRYVLEYDVEEPERYFENAFLVACGKFAITMDYPAGMKAPTVYEVSLETEAKKKTSVQPAITKAGSRNIAKWSRKEMPPGLSYRFEW
ncbi:MAG: adenylate/guanylate cyclase domain-containing protein [Nitrososphaera sp.]|uniref:adenylate/guanylate cyclase domain-containing protein n=1 Tax=Nitrososphaera sp. TaxID=1971748 RepID=UPI00316C17D9